MAGALIPWHDESSPKWSASHHWRCGREAGYPACCIVWFLVRAQIVTPWAGVNHLGRLPLTNLWIWMGGDPEICCGYVRCLWCRWIGKIGETNTVKQRLSDGMKKESEKILKDAYDADSVA